MGGFDDASVPCYTVGFSPTSTYSTSNTFYTAGGLPRSVLNTEPGDFIWTGEPDNDYRLPINRAILLRSAAANNITDVTKIPGGDHYIKIRYATVATTSDFSTIAGLTTINS